MSVLKSKATFPDEAVRDRPFRRRGLLAVALGTPFISRALAYPGPPIRVIVPGPPGGMADLAARAIGDAMQEQLGRPWLVDPRPGASGIIAARAFLDAPPDGHTL